MSDNGAILTVRDLRTHFFTEDGVARAVDGVSFAVGPRQTFALVGESGCGKSVTALSIMRLVPHPPGRIVSGQIELQGMPLTELGEALGKLKVEIDVPRDIPCLGIKKGRMELQRFFYWNICKLFYRPDFALDEMHHINFDWFRPLNCHRHTKEEIISCCDASGLTIERMNVQPAGFTVVARKR